MKHKYLRGKKQQQKIQSSLYGWLRKQNIRWEDNTPATKDLSLPHAKHYASQNELVFPTDTQRQVMLISSSNIIQAIGELKSLNQV